MFSSNPISTDAGVASPAFLDKENIEGDHASASIRAAVINQSGQVPYDFWRDFSNLPVCTKNIYLTSEIIEDIPDERIAWRSSGPCSNLVSAQKPTKPIDAVFKAKVSAVRGTRSSAFIVLLTGAVWLVGCGENSPSTPAEMSPAVSKPAEGVPGQAAPEAKATSRQADAAPPPPA